MKFPYQEIFSFEDAQTNFEALQALTILNETAAGVLNAPSGAMVSQARVLGTAYQPNALRPTFVIATFVISQSDQTGEVQVLMDAAHPPTTVIAEAYEGNTDLTAGVNVKQSVTFLVPPAFYYKFNVVSTGNALTLQSTYEYAL